MGVEECRHEGRSGACCSRSVVFTLAHLLLQVYHATCHAEAVVSTNTLAARLRTELMQRSRSGTPEAQSLRSTPPRATASSLKSDVRHSGSPSPESNRAASKRKIDSDTSLRDEEDGTPALKKVALTA